VTFAVQGALFDHADRRTLTDGAWVEVCSGWLPDGDALCDELLATTPWRAAQLP
jgi:hypothetical protein